jgi:hypothetical protein
MSQPTLADLERLIAHCRAHAIPPQPIDGELSYLMPLPADRVQAAFDAGLAPFCPLPGAKLPWLP